MYESREVYRSRPDALGHSDAAPGKVLCKTAFDQPETSAVEQQDLLQLISTFAFLTNDYSSRICYR